MTFPDRFHPAVTAWFRGTFTTPTPCQLQAWEALSRGRHALIAAPTGAGKTLAAFLAAIDDLVRRAAAGTLADSVQVLYVSPLKALSHDVEKNLNQPLQAIQQQLTLASPVRAQCRTSDTSTAARRAMAKRPPHILVTTPESLYILLTSASGRRMLSTVRTVIVDEIHAVIATKRGAHLALSLERLQRLTGHEFTRIGLSATQRPLKTVARFLLGAIPLEHCTLIDAGHLRRLDLDIELPDLPLEAVLSQEAAKSIHDRMAGLIGRHRTTLIFVNTRRQAERVARALSERLGENQVTAHHGSLSRQQRLEAENRLKAGQLKALVATASLELGIDIGDVDLVCQLGVTDSVATLLQRIGRAGHGPGRRPKGRLFPTTRDELVTALALIDTVRRGELEPCTIARPHLDVLAQQIVAAVAMEDFSEDDLYALVRRAAPYRGLPRETFDQVVAMLAEGYATSRGRRGAYLHRDRIQKRLRARRGARLTAVTCGGAIPDTADYRVILEPSGEVIGTVDEDFAIESLAGDIFQLGNSSWRVLRLEKDGLRVEDAQGQPPTIPFWFGEAPGRSEVLANAVSRLREEIWTGSREVAREGGSQGRREPFPGGSNRGHPGRERPEPHPPAPPASTQHLQVNPEAVRQAVDYLTAAGKALGTMPTRERIVLERFFDEAGDLHLVIHSPYGSRLNRAWGLALRKRFCRSFNFELQAAATEDALLLSLGSGQSFPLESVKAFLSSASVRHLLTQAIFDNPLFTARWRAVATISLAVRRFRAGKRTPPYLVRMEAEDLVTAVFPDQLACLENIQGDREIPDHPLVRQAIDDCLREAMDVEGLEAVLRGIETGAIEVVARETVEPSPLAAEMVGARVYAFLDGAPLEERRVRAVSQRRWLDPAEAGDLARLDPKAIERVRAEARPQPRDAEELLDALLACGYLLDTEIEPGWHPWLTELQAAGRACRLGPRWIAAEHWPRWRSISAEPPRPLPALPPELAAETWEAEEALTAIVRARLGISGPVTAAELAAATGVGAAAVEQALLRLEQEGSVLQGDYGWCERGLLARIHRLTLQKLRAEIEPVSSARFLAFFLQRWQHLHPDTRLRGPDALKAVLEQLEGFEAPAPVWERALLPARLPDYDPAWLDRLCQSGRFVWARLTPSGRRTPVRRLPVAFLPRRRLPLWLDPDRPASQSPSALRVLETLAREGALFFDELQELTRLLPSQLEDALAELAAQGQVSCDSFEGLRALLLPESKKRRYRRLLSGLENAGRWQRLRPAGTDADAVEHRARVLLRRYGIVFRALAAREAAMPPWLELVRVYRRLEAQGEIRGGRFVAGQFGEQFALPEAVTLLRRTATDEPPAAPGSGDPLALVTGILPGLDRTGEPA
ncbi:ATP-dependent helicase Lhr and Lhr-like helicase [Methylomarinovum caldicuralii]|uniref:ATP-dependent helicase Lhr and Lhr-like helicase n=1 Tax=Methylomarinovum caldicuralii TaxID=438856 RepID=A0AAU9C7P5_9GAMM|nr:DEAD/DEAH box helicase [Methylomarinovum caldicuralii]BCX82079.1 ATP-dependent helicase Lhr and Lhr-like helicase [Methylomarinovum caldicuralii]